MEKYRRTTKSFGVPKEKSKKLKDKENCCAALLINYYNTPCGMFNLDCCPFDCKNCDDCKELFQEKEKIY